MFGSILQKYRLSCFPKHGTLLKTSLKADDKCVVKYLKTQLPHKKHPTFFNTDDIWHDAVDQHKNTHTNMHMRYHMAYSFLFQRNVQMNMNISCYQKDLVQWDSVKTYSFLSHHLSKTPITYIFSSIFSFSSFFCLFYLNTFLSDSI